MKKIFIPSMLLAFAMICSCQKQDSTVEQQLAAKHFAMEISNRPEMDSNGVAFPRVRGAGALGRVHGKLKQRKNIKL